MKRLLSRVALALAVGLTLVVTPVGGFAEDARYIIQFRPGRAEAARGAVNAAGGRIVVTLGPQNAVAAILPEQAVAGLSRNPNIEFIEIDPIRTPMAVSDTTLASGQILPYGVQMVQADLVSSTNEDAMKVCIIDSGYSQQHIDLRDDDASDAITQKTSDGGSGTWDQDSCGHGTHVAGTVMATADNDTGVIGVLPGARLHVVKVFGNDILDGGSCTWTYSSTLINALNNCEAAGAKVTSMSLGGSLRSRAEDRAFADAYKRGMLHVAAAGNAGNNTTSFPAGYASVISVAAVDSNETVADFSQRNRDVEIAAPGVGVLSTVPWHDANTVTFADTSQISGGHVEFSARTTGTSGVLTNGGLCDSVGSWAGQVVLCQRGSISFNEKVQNVRSGGGVAAVIYNNVSSDATCGDFTGTLGDGNTSDIPAVTGSCADGASALTHVGTTATVVSQLSVPASGYEAWNGTSMATPHVSAVAAMIWSCYPSASNQTIRDAMKNTAKDKGAAGKDNTYGHGIVQAKAAVDSLGGSALCTTSGVSKY